MIYKTIKNNPYKLISAAVVVLLAFQFLGPLLINRAHASGVEKIIIRTDRMLTSTATTGMVCIAPATSSSDVKTYLITWPTGYTVSSTAANWQTTNIDTSATGSWPSGAVAWPNATSATASPSSQTVTWTNSSVQTMNTGSTYCFNWTASAALSTQSSASTQNSVTVTTKDHLGAVIDTNTAALGTVSNDQITVTATVNQTFSFALSSSTDALGTLSISSVTTSPTPRTITVNTNALNGWYTWGQDSNQGLNSSTASYTVASNCSSFAGTNTTLAAGTEGYNLGVTTSQTSGTGTITVQTPFVGGSLGRGGGLCKASGTTSGNQVLTSSNGTAGNAVLTLNNNAAISGATKAASDYTDLETFVGAGSF